MCFCIQNYVKNNHTYKYACAVDANTLQRIRIRGENFT